MTVDAIKAAIAELSEEDASSLAIWLMEKGYDQWDREMVADFTPGGRGTELFEQVQREIAEGQAIPMSSALAERRARRT